MKKSIVLASFVTLALSAPLAFSEEAHHAPDKKTTSAKPADMADKHRRLAKTVSRGATKNGTL